MKSKEQCLAEKAQEYRNLADNECYEFNAAEEESAVREFEDSEAAAFFRDNAKYATGIVVCRLEALRKNKPIFPIPLPEEDMFVRLLSTQTDVDYEEKGFDDDLSDEETIEAWENGDLIHDGYMSVATTSTTLLQRGLYQAFCDYTRAAAVRAKHIKSDSLLDWAGMIDILENRPGYRCLPLSEEEARRLLALERTAADRLRIDEIIFALPSEKRTKRTKKSKGAR